MFSSRIKKIALATESAPMANVTTAAVLKRASSPKPKNNSAAQDTKIDRNGQVTELSICNLVPKRRSWIDAVEFDYPLRQDFQAAFLAVIKDIGGSDEQAKHKG